MLYPYHTDKNAHAYRFYERLDTAIKEYNETQEGLTFVKAYADNRFNTDRIMSNWRYALGQIREEYGDDKSLPKEMVRIKIGN
jgi:hypothetical protein